MPVWISWEWLPLNPREVKVLYQVAVGCIVWTKLNELLSRYSWEGYPIVLHLCIWVIVWRNYNLLVYFPGKGHCHIQTPQSMSLSHSEMSQSQIWAKSIDGEIYTSNPQIYMYILNPKHHCKIRIYELWDHPRHCTSESNSQFWRSMVAAMK